MQTLRSTNGSGGGVAKITIKGVFTTYKTLADGTRAAYHYHRASGAPLPGEKGSPEYLAAYLDAERLAPRDVNNVAALIRAYLESPRFEKNKKGKAKAEGTMREYRRMATALEAEFGKMPIRALDSPKVRGVFLDYHEDIGRDRPREADNRLTVMSIILAYAADKGRITRNPLERFERLYSADRADMVWTEADVTRFMDGAAIDLQRAMILAIHTGQRYGDLIRLRWADYDGVKIRLKQGKTAQRVVIDCTTSLKRMLDATARRGPFILTRADGTPWHTAKDDKALAKAWHQRMEDADFYPTGWDSLTDEQKREHLRFNDLRGTAVTLLAEAKATIPQICAITGHTLQSATRILERYLSMTEALSSAAIHLFENAPETAFANRLQTGSPVANVGGGNMKGNQ